MNRIAILILCLALPFYPVRPQQVLPVKIGLLIEDRSSQAAKEGAALAIKIANDKGKSAGPRFQLVTKDMEGPWGTGSKQAVDLVFEDKVWAILGSHDGRNAHLVEQAATKARVVFISSWSSDPTLSQAFVPWFFNCVPNDRQQADELIKEIYIKRKFSRVAVIADNAYDSNQALKSFLKSAELSGKGKPVNFLFNNYIMKPDSLAEQVSKMKASCVVLFCQPSASLKIIRMLHQRKMNLPLYGSLSILNENLLSDKELGEFENSLQIVAGTWNESKNAIFRKEYNQLYGKMPGIVAAYAFDGMNLLIEATKVSQSPDLEKIKKALSDIRYEGVTGPIRFDSKGNREGTVAVMKILNGLPVIAGIE